MARRVDCRSLASMGPVVSADGVWRRAGVNEGCDELGQSPRRIDSAGVDQSPHKQVDGEVDDDGDHHRQHYQALHQRIVAHGMVRPRCALGEVCRISPVAAALLTVVISA
jgi:hypothetical protein